MIIYQELSSLEKDLEVSARALYSLSNSIHTHYHKVKIPKENGEFRELSVPDAFLKAVQRKIAKVLLSQEEISPFATAYRYGSNTCANALPHLGQPMVMKLDIRQFFDHCIYPIVKKYAFPAHKYSESNRVLLTLLCTYRDALPQGAPTSPAISNLILKDFDNTIGLWCSNRNIAYTRYCDDMTFSGCFDPGEIKALVKNELGKLGFFINDQKTVVLRCGQRKAVTGIVVNEKLNTPASYRRKLRQEIYYCRKFGVKSHIARMKIAVSEAVYLSQLLGKVNYALSVNPDDDALNDCRQWLLRAMASV